MCRLVGTVNMQTTEEKTCSITKPVLLETVKARACSAIQIIKVLVHQLRCCYVLLAASVEAVLKELFDSVGRPLYNLSCSNLIDNMLFKLVDPRRYHPSHTARDGSTQENDSRAKF
jgi:hypothetical protein